MAYDAVRVCLVVPNNLPTETVEAWHKLFPDTCQFIQTQLTLIASLLYPHDGLRGRPLSECRLELAANLPSDIPACASHEGRIQINCAYFMRQLSAGDPGELSKWNHVRFEMAGVLTHELVHLIQFDGERTAPWWFIEGLADFVRMQAGVSARHWQRPTVPESISNRMSLHIDHNEDNHHEYVLEESERRGYECGYAVTGFYFQYIERKFPQTILRMNATLANGKWDESMIKQLTGRTFEELWLAFLVNEHLTRQPVS